MVNKVFSLPSSSNEDEMDMLRRGRR